MTRQTRRRQAPIVDPIPSTLLLAAIDLIADGVALVDPDGVIRYVNQPLCELVGCSATELCGAVVDDLVPESRRAEHRSYRAEYAHEPIQRRMGRSDLDIEVRHADGRSIPVDIQLTPVPGTGIVVATIRDMTGERQAAVDTAIQQGELMEVIRRNEQLLVYYDVVLQHLFAIGTHLEVEARDSGQRGRQQRLVRSASMVDELIEITRNSVFGGTNPSPPTPSP